MLFENVLKTALRKLIRHKAYSLMNITGLTLGLAGAILIFLLIRFETSFDGFHSRGSRLFKIITEESHNGNVEKTQGTPGPLAETLSSGYESIEKTTMVYYQGGALFTVKRDPSDAKFQEKSGVAFASPSFFERVVVDLLVKMGYGGNRQDAGRAMGKSGDGGIDGIINEDRLGLDVIYIQAKRWEGIVGRPEIQKFAGALQGQRARKGVFITTSNFTQEAREYASLIE